MADILEELENLRGPFMGNRQLTRCLRRKYNLQVRRDTVMKSLRVIDPEGVEHRQRRRLKRRRYVTPGPNFLWHVDGWDKLAPFVFFVHGAVDGFSKRILWLEVNSTNKNPRVIASNYLNAVQQLGGVPRRMRCDRGTENAIIGTPPQFFRWYDDDQFAGNQRIEAWWSKFREGGGGWWINFFRDLRDCGLYHDDLVVELWNTHNIQRQQRLGIEGGKPDVMFFKPEIYGTHNYLMNVDIEDVTLCKEMYAESCVENNEDLEELVRLIKPDYSPPSNEREALKLYSEIVQFLKMDDLI